MPSSSQIILCAAGGGKTSRIVDEAVEERAQRSLLVTYTRNNTREIERKLYERSGAIPPNIEVMTWFGFLLRELARPYRNAVHGRRIEGLCWIEGRSARYASHSNVATHYFYDDRYIYSDKISKFICACDEKTGGAVFRRLAQRFDRIYVDEIQDMAGYDIDVLERAMKAGVRFTLVGDHRQATFRTNQSNRNSAFGGIEIAQKFKQWEKAKIAALTHEQHTFRCHQQIADLSDSLFPDDPPTKSLNDTVTGHDGVFIVPSARVSDYVAEFSPQALRYDKRTDCLNLPAMNFGDSKGLTFDRVLIFPNGTAGKWLRSGNIAEIAGSITRMYVGITRARHSVAFVFDGTVKVGGAKNY